MSITTGDRAPDAALTDIEGNAVSLSDMWTKKPIVLVFLRHLGCIFCREQIARLKADYHKFQSRGAEIVCIAQGDSKTGKAFTILFDLPFPVLMCGADLSVFKNYGLQRGTLWQLFGLDAVVNGIRAVLAGHKQGPISGDGFQMPGVFVIDTSGTVLLARRHRTAADNPDNAELLAALPPLSK